MYNQVAGRILMVAGLFCSDQCHQVGLQLRTCLNKQATVDEDMQLIQLMACN